MADVTISCRDVKELNKMCHVLLNMALVDIKKAGINPLVTETYRSKNRQYYLYCQGRTISESMKAGISKAIATKYCNTTVGEKTWTMNSIHILRNAVDLIPQRNGKAIYNSEDKETKKIIEIMTKYSFEAGANWSTSKDSPHFQIKGVSTSAGSYSAKNTNVFITKMIQKALNKKLGIHLVTDGNWGDQTTAAVNTFRKKLGWLKNGKVGTDTLKKLLA